MATASTVSAAAKDLATRYGIQPHQAQKILDEQSGLQISTNRSGGLCVRGFAQRARKSDGSGSYKPSVNIPYEILDEFFCETNVAKIRAHVATMSAPEPPSDAERRAAELAAALQ